MSTAARTVVQPVAEEPVRTFSIQREDRIEASIEIVFETILEQMGPLNVKPDGVAMPMKLEAWPGLGPLGVFISLSGPEFGLSPGSRARRTLHPQLHHTQWHIKIYSYLCRGLSKGNQL